MGRNKKRRSKNTRPNKPRRQIPTREAEIDALAPAYADWIGKDSTNQESHHALEFVKMVLGFHRKLQPNSSCTSFRALPLEAALCLCVDEIAEGADFLFIPFVNSMSLYTNFLEQTDRWTGTTGQLEDLRVFYHRAHIAFDAVGPSLGVEWSELDQTEQLKFLEETPLAKKARNLLAAVDAQLHSDSGATWRQAFWASVTLFDKDAPDGNSAQVRFDILAKLGLTPIQGSAERLADIRNTFSNGDNPDRLALLENLVYACFEDEFSGDSSPYSDGLPVGHAIGRILAQAAATTGAISGLILTNPGALMPAGAPPETAEFYAEVGRRLKHLHELGLIVIGQDITIPTALRRCVLDVWENTEPDRLAA
ncbi:hypothetical protein [Arthrobacter sp. VKM Ac-2550]|uniref:hypothetical protein n=1 Tax=Crystallibacter permensis TaxID=1938888 RepID=UPI002226AC08|nr:hypothetical protein [Arthrobacter sp. VKM Ac-2550]MCW2134712.1 hypothetical protein [Arthrobacter sp. VKM Ac-2550]